RASACALVTMARATRQHNAVQDSALPACMSAFLCFAAPSNSVLSRAKAQPSRQRSHAQTTRQLHKRQRTRSMPETETSLIRLLLADDHEILRQGLKMLLSLQPEIEVVGEARTGREAVEQTLALHPHVVVLD